MTEVCLLECPQHKKGMMVGVKKGSVMLNDWICFLYGKRNGAGLISCSREQMQRLKNDKDHSWSQWLRIQTQNKSTWNSVSHLVSWTIKTLTEHPLLCVDLRQFTTPLQYLRGKKQLHQCGNRQWCVLRLTVSMFGTRNAITASVSIPTHLFSASLSPPYKSLEVWVSRWDFSLWFSVCAHF